MGLYGKQQALTLADSAKKGSEWKDGVSSQKANIPEPEQGQKPREHQESGQKKVRESSQLHHQNCSFVL